MKHTHHTLLFIILLLMAATPLEAEATDWEFTVSGIRYRRLSGSIDNPDCALIGAESSVKGTVTIPERVTHGGYAYNVIKVAKEAFFSNRQIYHINLPSTITQIDEYAFAKCALKEITIPGPVKLIKHDAFAGSDIKTAVFSKNVSSMEYGVFEDCVNLVSLTLPRKIERIPSSLCSGCTKLKAVTIMEGTNVIGPYAFGHCISLDSINIPASINSIESDAFTGCKALDVIVNHATEPQEVYSDSFSHYGRLQVPSGYEYRYRADDVWGKFDIEGIPTPPEAQIWREDSQWEYYNADNQLLFYYKLGAFQRIGGIEYMPLAENDERIMAYVRTEEGDALVYARVVNRDTGYIYPEILLYDFRQPYADGEIMRLGTLCDDGSLRIDEVRINETQDAPIYHYDEKIAQWCNFISLIGCFHGPLDYFYTNAADKQPNKKNISHLVFNRKRSTRTDTFFPFYTSGTEAIHSVSISNDETALPPVAINLEGRHLVPTMRNIYIAGGKKHIYAPGKR